MISPTVVDLARYRRARLRLVELPADTEPRDHKTEPSTPSRPSETPPDGDTAA